MDIKLTLIYPLFASSLLAGLLGGCAVDGGQTEDQADQQSITTTPVIEVEALDTTIHQDYVANIQAFKNVEIRSRLRGFLEKIYIDEGSEVSQGQPLFKLSDTEYASDVARCEAVLENAIADGKTISLEVDRTKLLVEKNIVSKTDLEVAQAQLAAAESKIKEAKSLLQHAKAQLAYTTVRAPFTGRIDRIPLKEGSLLDEGALLTSISDLRNVYAYFDISEQEYLGIVANDNIRTVDFNMPVTLTLANGTVYPYTGTAGFAENEFEETTGTISLRALFPNPDGLIKHAASGKVGVPLQSGENLAVHQKSVFEIQDRTYVYKVKDGKTLVMTPFRAGPRIGHYYLVEDGLSARDTIVFEGVQNLRDGMTISPKMTSLADNQLAASGTQ
ncbi:efflux RND transporter periplasmic adaptor subunit [Parapedobacter koreensis]|uniref:Membrane fusion protein, multidrug efflux system n=1 Tax=Parapedobacter koreensis TaxID=332977 RepID=A0A1H7PHG3_9SPHI|nr:efflux RND transporter periplasmic adaptor subunit [Parapedobacter koreensis]SEL35049.1 membrane fusion protein, multidrug efflux system [Parapedobacter koreensis]